MAVTEQLEQVIEEAIEKFCEETGCGFGWRITESTFGTASAAHKAMVAAIAEAVFDRYLAGER